jgi:hypothetical protein
MDKQKKLAALEVKRSQINAQIQAIKARENGQQRKDDTRRKVLIGGVVLKMLKTGEMPQERLTQLLDKYLEAERDRKLFGLAPKQAEEKEP